MEQNYPTILRFAHTPGRTTVLNCTTQRNKKCGSNRQCRRKTGRAITLLNQNNNSWPEFRETGFQSGKQADFSCYPVLSRNFCFRTIHTPAWTTSASSSVKLFLPADKEIRKKCHRRTALGIKMGWMDIIQMRFFPFMPIA